MMDFSLADPDALDRFCKMMQMVNDELRLANQPTEIGEDMVTIISTAAEYIRHLRGIIAATIEQDGSGYFPFVAEGTPLGQILVQVFRDDDGSMTCHVAHRGNQWDTWSRPYEAVKG